jgi:transposase InsO family protein
MKDGTSAAIKNVQAVAEQKNGRKLRALHTDHGGKFTDNHFKEYFAELGVQRQLTAPYLLLRMASLSSAIRW